METVLKSSQELYGNMIWALNQFYWDNQISPDETAARLDEFSKEVTRLSEYIRANAPSQTRPPEQRNEAESDIREALCQCHIFDRIITELQENRCFRCKKPLHS